MKGSLLCKFELIVKQQSTGQYMIGSASEFDLISEMRLLLLKK